jgi:ABC-type phosphate/phosphonate transport system substrate-binding protein
MAIPNSKKYQIRRPNSGDIATIVAVLPKDADVNAYLADATKRFDWKAWDDQKASMNKVRVGQQKQRKK